MCQAGCLYTGPEEPMPAQLPTTSPHTWLPCAPPTAPLRPCPSLPLPSRKCAHCFAACVVLIMLPHTRPCPQVVSDELNERATAVLHTLKVLQVADAAGTRRAPKRYFCSLKEVRGLVCAWAEREGGAG